MQYIYYYFSEIRLRFVYTCLAFLLSFVLSYIFKYEFFYLLSKPFLFFSPQFIFFELTEGLYTLIRISLIVSLISIIPFLWYQFWSFYMPSCYIFERKKYNFYSNIFIFLLLIEFYFLYSVLFPGICKFLVSFELKPSENLSNVSIEFAPRIASYIKLMSQLFSLFLIFFQLPFLFIGIFARNILTSYNLCEYRKIIFFLCLLLAAFISPPDFLSQAILTSILYFIFEFIIFLGFFI